MELEQMMDEDIVICTTSEEFVRAIKENGTNVKLGPLVTHLDLYGRNILIFSQLQATLKRDKIKLY